MPESGWIHLVGTYADNTVKIYVNGQLQGVTDQTDGVLNISTEPLIIGRQIIPDVVGYPFVGVICDVRVYNKALTAAEVLRNYLAGRSSP
ncbi:MAG: LamG domain-containing protein [Peptococcia bacterium]